MTETDMEIGESGDRSSTFSFTLHKRSTVPKSSVASIFSTAGDDTNLMMEDCDLATPSSSSSEICCVDAENCFGVILPSRGAVLSAIEFSSLSLQLKDMGNEFAEREEFSHALRCWNAALRFDSDNGILHELKAQVYMSLDADDARNEGGRPYALQAVLSAQRAIELLPEWCEGYQTLARAQMNIGEIQLGVLSFRNALRLDVNSEVPDIADELKQAEESLRLLEAARNSGAFEVDKEVVRELLPPLRKNDADVEEVQRCIRHLSSRPGYN